MYYAHFILNKKGPLAKIWLAAHWDKKLTKAQIYETNIESTIETILEPQMKLALRTSGHLLLGVCRIYSRKVKYLLADCNEAFVKIKLAFRPGLIDLPKEKQQASVDAITLPEKFPDFYVNFEDINMEDMDLTKQNLTQQARIEDITLKEDFGTFVATQDDDFGDMDNFGMDMDTFMISDLEKGRQISAASLIGENNLEQNDEFFDDRLNNHSDFANDISSLNKPNDKNNLPSIDLNDLNNDLNSERALIDSAITNKITDFNQDLEQPANDAMEDTIMHDEMQEIDTNEGISGVSGPAVVPTLFEDQPTVNAIEEPIQKIPRLENDVGGSVSGMEVPKGAEEEEEPMNIESSNKESNKENEKQNERDEEEEEEPVEGEERTKAVTSDQNVNNNKENLDEINNNNNNNNNNNTELDPILDILAKPADLVPTVIEKQIRTRRRRKLIIDEMKEIDSATMKAQLSDTSAIVGQLELAPPTRRLMQLKETSSIDKMFAFTSRPLHSRVLQKMYSRNMATKSLADITNIAKLLEKAQLPKEPTPAVQQAQAQAQTQAENTNQSIARKPPSPEPEPEPEQAPAPPAPTTTTTESAVNEDESNQINDLSIEANLNDKSVTKPPTPPQTTTATDSLIENNNETSKLVNDEGNKTDKQQENNNDLDEFDQFGGPASIFNTTTNLEEMLLEEYPNQINLDITVTSPGDKKEEKEATGKDEEEEEDEAESSEDEEEEEGQETGAAGAGGADSGAGVGGTAGGSRKSKEKSEKNQKSPSTKPKRSYRRSTNFGTSSTNNNKENKDTTIRDDATMLDETMFDDTLTNDPTKNLNKRAKTMVSILNKSFNKSDNVGFFELTRKNGRKHVAQKFYSLLVLKKYEIIEVSQDDTYGDIIICKGEKFDSFAPN